MSRAVWDAQSARWCHDSSTCKNLRDTWAEPRLIGVPGAEVALGATDISAAMPLSTCSVVRQPRTKSPGASSTASALRIAPGMNCSVSLRSPCAAQHIQLCMTHPVSGRSPARTVETTTLSRDLICVKKQLGFL